MTSPITKQTDGHRDSINESAQWADSVKKKKEKMVQYTRLNVLTGMKTLRISVLICTLVSRISILQSHIETGIKTLTNLIRLYTAIKNQIKEGSM